VDFEVVIIGSGVTGSLLAAFLSSKGLKVCLIDKNRPLNIDKNQKYTGKTAALNLFSLNIIKEMGLWEALMPEATRFDKLYVWDGEGSSSINFSASDIQEDNLGFVVSNNSLLISLRKLLSNLDSLSFKFDQEVVEIKSNKKFAEIYTSNGEKITSNLIVGADGSRSSVRQLLKIRSRTWSYNQTAFVASLNSEHQHENTAWQVFTKEGPLALLPFDDPSGPGLSLIWSVRDELSKAIKEVSKDDFLKILESKTERVLGNLQLSSEFFFFPLKHLHAKEYYSKRTVLVGDAAHTIHPLAGQGLNLGLADVYSLQEMLIQARRKGLDLGSEEMLSKYQKTRQTPNMLMAAFVQLFKDGFEDKNPWIKFGRNLAFQVTTQNKWLKRKFIKEAAGLI